MGASGPTPFLMRLTLLSFVLLTSLAAAQPRNPVVSSVEKPVRAERKADGRWFIDFGKAAFGNVTLTAPAGTDAAKVTVHLGEALSGSNTVHRTPGGTVRYQRHEIRLSPGQPVSPPLTWAPPGWMKEGWLARPAGMPEVMPFRYVEIEGVPATFTPEQIRRVAWWVPFDDTAASFTSSSPELDGVWDLCKYSIKATSFLGLYVDGDRERKPYEADALINQLAHYCVDQHYDTARLTHEFLLAQPTWPTEWRLQSVMLGWLDFLWSGDDASLRRHYDTLKGRAMIERRTPDGWFRGHRTRGEAPGLEDIVDWPAGERDGYDMKVEAKSAVVAFHYQALVLLEKIATHLGKTEDAKEFAALAQATHQTFNAKLWDETRGCYLDGLNPDTGAVSAHASAHANFFPLALGLVPPERVPRVAAFLKSRGMVCSVYGSQFLIEALYEAGEAEFALALLTSNELRSWRNMSEKVGSTIALEAWDPKLKPNLDWNHAWGAAPANLIPRGLMGIEPIEPGFRRFRVRPQTASLTQAGVKMPTPKGPITLSVRRPSKSDWSADITVPKGTVAEFHVPAPRLELVKLSSGKPKLLREAGGRIVIELVPGAHQISVATQPASPSNLRVVPN
jgi:alpha-L-rhamnosidase